MRIPDRTPETLRKLHSLSGMIPLAVFLLEHLTVNSFAVAGPEAFRRVASAIGGIPMLAALELAGIALPLAVHSVIGILIATELPERGGPDWPDRRAIIQRATGLLILPYLIYHVWSTRLSPDVLARHVDLFEVMSRQVRHPGGLLFHAAGVGLTAWHLGNGLPSFARRFGLARGPASERALARAGALASLVLAAAGIASLIAFANHAPSAPGWALERR